MRTSGCFLCAILVLTILGCGGRKPISIPAPPMPEKVDLPRRESLQPILPRAEGDQLLKLAWPLEEKVITSACGMRTRTRYLLKRSGKRKGSRRLQRVVEHFQQLHTGIDLGAPVATPIKAAAAGTVVYAGGVRGYGLTIELDHGGGIQTLYAHARELLVSLGDPVIAGQVIARVGQTGNATGPHLHFELRRDGEAVDPLPYLPR